MTAAPSPAPQELVAVTQKLPAPFAYLRIHPDDGITVVPDESYKPGSVVFRVYSEQQVTDIASAAREEQREKDAARLASATEALKPFATAAKQYGRLVDDESFVCKLGATVIIQGGDLRVAVTAYDEARAALKAAEEV